MQSKPDLKIVDHPKKDECHHMRVIDFGWGKLTIETDGSILTAERELYTLEMARREIMGW